MSMRTALIEHDVMSKPSAVGAGKSLTGTDLQHRRAVIAPVLHRCCTILPKQRRMWGGAERTVNNHNLLSGKRLS